MSTTLPSATSAMNTLRIFGLELLPDEPIDRKLATSCCNILGLFNWHFIYHIILNPLNLILIMCGLEKQGLVGVVAKWRAKLDCFTDS